MRTLLSLNDLKSSGVRRRPQPQTSHLAPFTQEIIHNPKFIRLNVSLSTYSILEIQDDIFSMLPVDYNQEIYTMIDLCEYEKHEIYRMHFYIILLRLTNKRRETAYELKKICCTIEDLQRKAPQTSLSLLHKITEATELKNKLTAEIDKLDGAIKLTRMNVRFDVKCVFPYFKIDL